MASGGGASDPLALEKLSQFFQRTSGTHPGGVFGDTQHFTDGTKVALLEEPKHDGRTILSAQLIDGVIENGCDLG